MDKRDTIIKFLAVTFVAVVCISVGLGIASHREHPRRWVVVDVDIPVRMQTQTPRRYFMPSVQGSSAFDAAIMAQSNPTGSIRATSLP